jgi:hypothetical protein
MASDVIFQVQNLLHYSILLIPLSRFINYRGDRGYINAIFSGKMKHSCFSLIKTIQESRARVNLPHIGNRECFKIFLQQ